MASFTCHLTAETPAPAATPESQKCEKSSKPGGPKLLQALNLTDDQKPKSPRSWQRRNPTPKPSGPIKVSPKNNGAHSLKPFARILNNSCKPCSPLSNSRNSRSSRRSTNRLTAKVAIPRFPPLKVFRIVEAVVPTACLLFQDLTQRALHNELAYDMRRMACAASPYLDRENAQAAASIACQSPSQTAIQPLISEELITNPQSQGWL